MSVTNTPPFDLNFISDLNFLVYLTDSSSFVKSVSTCPFGILTSVDFRLSKLVSRRDRSEVHQMSVTVGKGWDRRT